MKVAIVLLLSVNTSHTFDDLHLDLLAKVDCRLLLSSSFFIVLMLSCTTATVSSALHFNDD